MIRKQGKNKNYGKKQGEVTHRKLPNVNLNTERRNLWSLPIGFKAPVKRFTKEEIAEYEANLAKK